MPQLVEIGAARSYTSAEARRLTRLSAAELETLREAGLVPSGDDGFAFQDIVVMRTLRQLREAGLSRTRVKRALQKLAAQVDEPSTTRLWCDGGRIVAQQGSERWQPESGQRLLNFDARPAAAPPTRMPQPVSQADDWFAEGCALEGLSTEQAVASYRRALDLEPNRQEAHVNLGRLLHESGDLEAAERHYRAAADLTPDDAICLYNLGVVLQDQRRDREALEAYEKALQIDPQLRDAHFNLAQLYERSGQRLSALQHLSVYRRLSR